VQNAALQEDHNAEPGPNLKSEEVYAMKRVTFACLLIVSSLTSSLGAEVRNSIGINYGPKNGGTWGLQADFDFSSVFNKAPVAVQIFWKTYSKRYDVAGADYKYGYYGLGGALIYDFSAMAKLGRIRPYAGLGYMDLTANMATYGNLPVAPDKGGLYGTAGIRYWVTPRFSADVGLNNITGVSLGGVLAF
jgi:hypothetical protein